MFGDRQLVISDLQLPFECDGALRFCQYVQKHFKINSDNILCVGDEVDQYFGSMYKHSADAEHTANSEIRETKEKLKKWFSAFPNMIIAESNHGQRWAKKAAEAFIPVQMMRKYQEALETPEGWRWARQWKIVCEKHTYILKHGTDCGGKTPYRIQAEINSFSTVFGHLHSSPGICRVKTDSEKWSMNVGCMIDPEKYAFEYERDNKFKPIRTIGVVIDSGRMPILVPYD